MTAEERSAALPFWFSVILLAVAATTFGFFEKGIDGAFRHAAIVALFLPAVQLAACVITLLILLVTPSRGGWATLGRILLGSLVGTIVGIPANVAAVIIWAWLA